MFMLVSSGGRCFCRAWLCIAVILGVMPPGLLPAADLPPLPAPVFDKVSQFKPNVEQAAIIRTDDGPWLVATASGNASPLVPPTMLRDSATRAGVVEAKRRMAELLSAEIATYIAAHKAGVGKSGITRKVTVVVSGQLLSRVQILRESYDPDTKRCHVVVASAPLGKAVGDDFEFPDAETAAQHLLERFSQCLCPPGVICIRLRGSVPNAPRLAFISLAVGPRAANGRREVANAKALALLARFWSETLESRVDFEQGEISDPHDPKGSRLLNYEYLEEWTKSREASHVLPPFKSIGLDRDDLSFAAIWCTN